MSERPPYGRDRKGNVVDDAYVQQALEEAEQGWDLRAAPGLDVTFDMTDDLRERAEAEAARRGCTVSQLAREALEQFLAS